MREGFIKLYTFGRNATASKVGNNEQGDDGLDYLITV